MEKIIIASGPVIVEDGKVLLTKHGDTPFWKFCGGKVEDKNESLLDAAKREAKEEMGIDLKILNEEPFLMYTNKEKDGLSIDVILVHYLAERIGEAQAGDDIDEWKWIEIKDLENEELAPNIMPALRHFGLI